MKNILALLADWANGLFALLLALYVTDTEIVWWYIPVALMLSPLPDVDAIPELLQRGKVAASAVHVKDHRTFLHYPIVSLVACTIAWFTLGFWGVLICFSVALHLLNDLYGAGWGLPVFWPVSSRHYKVLGRRVNWPKKDLVDADMWGYISRSERRLRLVVSWTEDEMPDYVKKWGIDNWVDIVYFKITWISVVEYAAFIIAVGTMLLYLVS